MKKFLGAKKTLSAIVFINCSLTDCEIRKFFISLNDIIFHGKFRSFGKISFVHKNEAYNFCRYLIRILQDSSSIFLSLRSIGGDRSKQNSRNLPPQYSWGEGGGHRETGISFFNSWKFLTFQPKRDSANYSLQS